MEANAWRTRIQLVNASVDSFRVILVVYVGHAGVLRGTVQPNIQVNTIKAQLNKF